MTPAAHPKACSRCSVVKPPSGFTPHALARDGLRTRCKACEADLARERRSANREKYREADRLRRIANPDKFQTRDADYRSRNPDARKKAQWEWRERYPERQSDASRRWREANPHKVADKNSRYRALLVNSSVGVVDLEQLWGDDGGACQLCGDAIDIARTFPDPLSKSVDHIVPLSKGGTHEQSNLQWTHLVCNQRKGATVPDNTHPFERNH